MYFLFKLNLYPFQEDSMNKLIMKSALIFAFMGTSFVTASDNQVDIEYRVLTIADLTKDDIERFCKGKMDGVILSIEGTTLSINVDIKSNLFEGEKHTPRKVKVLKPCFMKCSRGTHYFSSDYRTWHTFKAFFDQDLDISMDIDEQTYLVNITLHLDLHQKD